MKYIFSAIFIVVFAFDAFSWGQKGHDVTCAIAEAHLTNRAKKHITELLDGKSIVYWANWMDSASHTPDYSYTKSWHYKNIDADQTFETAYPNGRVDVVCAVNTQIQALQGGKLTKEESVLALKFLVHMVRDLHSPMHMGHRTDLGGNKWQVRYFNKGTNLHKIWDSNMIEMAHKWSYSEWRDQIDIRDAKRIEEIVAGNPNEWARQTYDIVCQVYDATPVGSKLSFDYLNQWTPVIEQQLLYAGLRLASVLNELF